ncbi:MAG: hypothetical protein K8I02_12250, partial [Candidatus Methylomirabilis sp.]|nr:hypothetical protein [Deltaproteobacteria bacterium]
PSGPASEGRGAYYRPVHEGGKGASAAPETVLGWIKGNPGDPRLPRTALTTLTNLTSFSDPVMDAIYGAKALPAEARKALLIKATPFKRASPLAATVFDGGLQRRVPAKVYEINEPSVLAILMLPEAGERAYLISELGHYTVDFTNLFAEEQGGAYVVIGKLDGPFGGFTSSVYSNTDQTRHYTVYAADGSVDLSLALPAREPIPEPRTYVAKAGAPARLTPMNAGGSTP